MKRPLTEADVLKLQQRSESLSGRRCCYCGKSGGPAHIVQVNGQMRSFYLHRACVEKFKNRYGDK